MSLEPRVSTTLYHRDPEAVTLGGLFLLLFAVNLWTAGVSLLYEPLSVALPRPLGDPFLLGPILVHGLGTLLATVVYLRVTGVSLSLGLPTHDRETGAVTPFLSVGLVAIGALVAHGLLGSSVSEVVRSSYGASMSVAFLAWVTLVPAVFAALAYGLLYLGAVQRTLRELVDPGHAVGLTVFVVGIVRAMDPPSLARPSPESLGLFLLLALVAAAVGFTAGIAYRGAGATDPKTVVRGWYVPVLVVGVVGIVGVATEFTAATTLLRWGLYVGTVAVAAYAHERTASLWVGVVTLFCYHVAVNVAVYLEAMGGVGTF
ncbi:hypothetical protein [Halorarius litoreus]|uniref:hypothetical protein n=1 Tax=Halorarius litoreus TaxID=2962676 RepID=UPI0020CD5229|nr:hypothetical protein [Halorarius litoreus]